MQATQPLTDGFPAPDPMTAFRPLWSLTTVTPDAVRRRMRAVPEHERHRVVREVLSAIAHGLASDPREVARAAIDKELQMEFGFG